MSGIEFQPWPKIARLNRDIVITEKIDGTNAAVLIVEIPFATGSFPDYNRIAIITDDNPKRDQMGDPFFEYHVYAQSRNKFIIPGKSTDNYGFAGWVAANAEALVLALGEGRHFGEWWGSGIQRGYGLMGGERYFSLFNTARWTSDEGPLAINRSEIHELDVVPVLYEGPYNQTAIHTALKDLRDYGSLAAPGFMNPEGIVIYHTALRSSFKVTLEGDAAPKGEAGHKLDYEVAA